MRAVLRYNVLVGETVEHRLRGRIVKVGCRDPRMVEFWVLDNSDADPLTVQLRVFGTGEVVPDDAVYVGTAVPPQRPDLVWHLFRL